MERCLDCCCGLINVEVTFMGLIAHCFEARRGLPPFSWMGHGPFPISPPALLSLTVVDGGGEPALLWEAAVMAGTGRASCLLSFSEALKSGSYI
jgi:hypothetical protein